MKVSPLGYKLQGINMVDYSVTYLEYWKCPSCLESVPFGFEHVCPAKTSSDQGISVFPGQLSMIEINKKLDLILADMKEIKDKIKE